MTHRPAAVMAPVACLGLFLSSMAVARGSHRPASGSPAARCGAAHVLPHPNLPEIMLQLDNASIGRGTLAFSALSDPITISDGARGGLTAIRAADTLGVGLLEDVFFWHNATFVRLASKRTTTFVKAIKSPRAGVFQVYYARYKQTDPQCCPSLPPIRITYRWTGRTLSASGVPPALGGQCQDAELVPCAKWTWQDGARGR